MPLDFTLPTTLPQYNMLSHGTVVISNMDVERATKEYLFSTGRYENPDEVWEDVPYHIKFAAVQYTKRILIAALGGDPDDALPDSTRFPAP